MDQKFGGPNVTHQAHRGGLNVTVTFSPPFIWGWTKSFWTHHYRVQKVTWTKRFWDPVSPRTKRAGRIVTRTKGGWTKRQGTDRYPPVKKYGNNISPSCSQCTLGTLGSEPDADSELVVKIPDLDP